MNIEKILKMISISIFALSIALFIFMMGYAMDYGDGGGSTGLTIVFCSHIAVIITSGLATFKNRRKWLVWVAIFILVHGVGMALDPRFWA